MKDLVADLRHAARYLLRRPGFSSLVVLTLGLGMAAIVAVWSLADAVLLRPLPFPGAERLVAVWESPATEPQRRNVVSPANYVDWKAESRSFETLGAWFERSLTLSGAGEPAEVQAAVASHELFAVTGLAPLAGSWPAAGGGAAGGGAAGGGAIVLSRAFWQRRFGGDPAVVGTTVALDGGAYEVAAVAPEGLALLAAGVDLWMARDYRLANRETMGRFVRVAGRLAPGVTLDAAAEELAGVAADLARRYPDFNAGWGTTVVPLDDELLGDSRPILRVLLLSAGLLLAIACANGANLLLAHGLARGREVAIRISLGARRRHVARQFLLESLLLSLAAAAVTMLAVAWLPAAVGALPQAARLPRMGDAGVDLRVAAVALLAAVATTLVAGAAPILVAGRRDPREVLQDGGRQVGARRSGRLRSGLVVAEVALSLVLLAGAGLMARSLAALGRIELGFEPGGVATARVPLPAAYRDAAKQEALVERVVAGLATSPGIEAAGAVNYLPLSGLYSTTGFWDADRPKPRTEELPSTGVHVVSPGYVEAIGVPLLAGRDLDAHDTTSAPRVALVNRRLAETMWPGEDPLGKRITVWWTDDPTVEVVGVVADVRTDHLEEGPGMEVYLPFGQGGATTTVSFVARATAPASALRLLPAAVHAVDPALAVADVEPLVHLVGATVAAPRLQTLLLAVFALAALALTAVGLYGVLSQVVVARSGEIGVRMALGARRGQILRQTLAAGMTLVAVGLGAGVLLWLAAGRVLESLLYEVAPTDPLALTAAAGLLATVAVVACLAPARRAATVDPLAALRGE